jgi:hypothetical protein
MRNALFMMVMVAPLSCAQTKPAPVVTREAAVIDWDAYRTALEETKSRSDRTRAGNIGQDIRRTQFPVLLATHDDVRAAPDFRTQGTSYVAHYKPDLNIEISVLGSASHVVATSPSPVSKAKPAPYQFEVLDDITDLTFRRFGATYTIRASCVDEADPRCKQPGYFLAFMRSLTPVAR